ncbi:MAG: DUF1266 domain-containing protein [Treponema sp.]|jgi:hypothetical protein|nr:DUF1266 domain-containing protein [Treponema sp.]
MKKYLVLIIIFLAFNSLLFAQLTRAQMWAISLTGIMTEINGSYRNSLNVSMMDAISKLDWLIVLARDWGITTRQGLLDTLNSLENGGHAASFREIQGILYEVSRARNESEAEAILLKYDWDQTKVNRLNYVAANWSQYYNRTIKAWDLGRCISLCRWGYDVGFLTETEAWERIFHFASLIQPLYNSWEEYGYDYYMGRIFWASGFGEQESYLASTEPVYRKLLNSYWGWLDWQIDLNRPETAVPVNTIYYLEPADNDGMIQYRTNDSALSNRPISAYVPNPNADPNVYECKVKKISGSDIYSFGILFCVDDTNHSYYQFTITVNGTFSVRKCVGNRMVGWPVEWRDSSFLNTGYNVYNTLRVERTDTANGATFRIYINDNLAAVFNDANPINSSWAGLVTLVDRREVELFPYIPVDVRFEF